MGQGALSYAPTYAWAYAISYVYAIRMTDHIIIHSPALSILDYAARIGKDHRTVREWLRKGMLPTAYQDGSRKWWIPADAEPVRAPVAPRAEHAPPSGDQPSALAVRESIAVPQFIPLYMPLADAAPLLGVTAYQIAQHPEEFGVVPWGDNGSLVVPVRRLLGLVQGGNG